MPYETDIIFTLIESLSDDEFQNLCLRHFKLTYYKFTDGQTKDRKIRLLVEHLDRHQEDITILLNYIKANDPVSYQQFVSQFSRRANIKQFPEISNFDLNNLMDKCIEEILDKQGLIGLSICCNEDIFLTNFCERLRKTLCRSNIQIRPRKSIKPQICSISQIVDSINKCQQVISNHDLIFPIVIDTHNLNSDVIERFWLELQNLFAGQLSRRLIVVMFCSGEHSCPPDILSLPPPQFRKSHVFAWINELASILYNMHLISDWREAETLDELVGNVVMECCRGEDGYLDISTVYDRLDLILSALQQEPSISPQTLMQNIYFK